MASTDLIDTSLPHHAVVYVPMLGHSGNLILAHLRGNYIGLPVIPLGVGADTVLTIGLCKIKLREIAVMGPMREGSLLQPMQQFIGKWENRPARFTLCTFEGLHALHHLHPGAIVPRNAATLGQFTGHEPDFGLLQFYEMQAQPEAALLA